MNSVWIQIFVLTFAECVAPAGKSVCQQQQFELHFSTRDDCELALQQFIAAKDALDNVIIDRDRSGCASTAMQVESYANLSAINAANATNADWIRPSTSEARRQVVSETHKARLVELKECDETSGVAPCKIGDIIVEEARGDHVEVWRRDGS